MYWRFPALCGAFFVLVCALFTDSLPVLDEESYLWIAQEMSWGRPYDWSLPWPPYNDAYVYAHPPLFLWWCKVMLFLEADSLWFLKCVLAAPWQFLLGGTIAHLLSEKDKKVVFFGLFALSPIVLMSSARGLMPDLMCTSLGVLGVALFIEANKRDKSMWLYVFSGLSLGFAAWTKYPALLLWGLVLAHHKNSVLRLIPMFLSFLLVFGGGELWLWILHGECHLWVVLSRAGEIARDSIAGKSMGFLTRFAWGFPFVILMFRLRTWVICIPFVLAFYGLTGLDAIVFVNPDSAPYGMAVSFGFFVFGTALGASVLVRLMRPFSLYAFWALLVCLGVLIFHNFTAPRYLLPMAAPLILLLRLPKYQPFILVVFLFSFGLTWWMNSAERRFAAAADKCAQEVSNLGVKGRFLGEWTHRWRLRKAGWTPWRPDDQGELLAIPENAASVSPPEGWTLSRRYECTNPGFSLLSSRDSIGWYSETLGHLPFGFSNHPLESIHVYVRSKSAQ